VSVSLFSRGPSLWKRIWSLGAYCFFPRLLLKFTSTRDCSWVIMDLAAKAAMCLLSALMGLSGENFLVLAAPLLSYVHVENIQWLEVAVASSVWPNKSGSSPWRDVLWWCGHFFARRTLFCTPQNSRIREWVTCWHQKVPMIIWEERPWASQGATAFISHGGSSWNTSLFGGVICLIGALYLVPKRRLHHTCWMKMKRSLCMAAKALTTWYSTISISLFVELFQY